MGRILLGLFISVLSVINISAQTLVKIPALKTQLHTNYILDSVIDARRSPVIGEAFFYDCDTALKIDPSVLISNLKSLIGINNNLSAQHIIIRINHLSVNAATDSEIIKCYGGLSLSFLKKDGEGYREIFQSAEHIDLESQSENVISESISGLLSQSITAFNWGVDLKYSLNNYLSIQTILSPQYVEPYQGNRIRGVYLNYYQYRDNKPDTSISAEYESFFSKRQELLYSNLSAEEPHNARAFYGFCMNDTVQIQYLGRFFPLYSENGFNYSFCKKILIDRPDEIDKQINIAVLWGLPGWTIYKIFRHFQESALNNLDGAYILDTRIGTMIHNKSFIDLNSVKDFKIDEVPTKPIVIISDKNSRKQEPLLVQSAGLSSSLLRRNEFDVLRIEQGNKPVSFTFSIKGQEPVILDIDCFSNTPTILLANRDKDGKLSIEKLLHRDYNDYFKRLENDDWSRAKKE